jgi:hypothetical protein
MPSSAVRHEAVVQWNGVDSEETFRERGGHPLYDELSIEYRFNSHGYRCPEFTEVADIRMISIGCSYVMGTGLPQRALFHELFAERLRKETGKTVVNWNLGESGTGNDAVERVLQLSVPLLDPCIILVLFPSIARREYLSPEGVRVTYAPRYRPANDSVKTEFMDRIAGITCQQDDELRFFRSYKSIETLLADRCWMFGFYDTEWIETCHVFRHVAPDRYIGKWTRLDTARDHGHPGPLTNERLYEGFWNTFAALSASGCCRALPY